MSNSIHVYFSFANVPFTDCNSVGSPTPSPIQQNNDVSSAAPCRVKTQRQRPQPVGFILVPFKVVADFLSIAKGLYAGLVHSRG